MAKAARARKRPVPDPVAPATVTLGDLIENLSSDLALIAAAPAGLDVTVSQPVIEDPSQQRTFDPGDAVLAIGIEPARREALDLVARAGKGRAAAVVFKTGPEVPAALADAARAANVALIAITQEITWEQIHVLLRTSLATAGLPPEFDPSGMPLGDLFALANAVASMVGGPTTIEDPHSRVLAYSSHLAAAIDEPRRQTILGQRVPEHWIKRLQDDGVFRRLWSGDEVVTVDYSPDDPTFRPRMAIAVRAGGEILGSIWVHEGTTPFGPDAEGALREAARIAALHLIRHRSSEDLERRRRSDVVRSVLDGRVPPSMLAASLGLRQGEGLTVVAFRLEIDADAAATTVIERALSLVTLYCTSYRRQATAVALGRVIYVLFPHGDQPDDPTRLVAVVTDFVRRVGGSLRIPVRAGIGSPAASATEVLASRRDADQALRALAEQRDDRQVARIDDVRATAILLELKEIAAEAPQLHAGKLATLIEHDRRRHTSFVETLRAYLDAFGDIPKASKAVNVHPNTFRYRMRRLLEVSGLDLDDPVERLVTQLQLAFLR